MTRADSHAASFPHGLALGAALLLFAAPLALAGPREARAHWKEAQAMKNAPWRERLQVVRSVRRETSASDSYFARALLAEASVLRGAGHLAGASAAEAFAACTGPDHEPDRLVCALTAARALASDLDRPGARALLNEILENGGSATPAITGPALELYGRLAADDRDELALDRLLARAKADVPSRPDVRLALLDLAGLLALDRGDTEAATRRLADARRVFTEARRAGGSPDRLASEAWLEMSLPHRLEALASGTTPGATSPGATSPGGGGASK